MKHVMFLLAVTFLCLTHGIAQTAYFNTPANRSIYGPDDAINVSFNTTGDADSVKLLLKGAGAQRLLELTEDADFSTVITGLVAGNYRLYAYVYDAGLYTVSTLQFSVVNGCCTVRNFVDTASLYGDLIDNDNGWEIDMSNYDINPHTFGYLRYDPLGQTSVGSYSNIDSGSISKSNLSQLLLASAHDQSFSLFSSSNDITKQRYGNAGIYGYGTADYENGGSGLSYEVSDSLGVSTIEQYSTGIDITAKNVNVVSDTVFVNSDNIVFSSTPTINGSLGLGAYNFGNGLFQDGSNVGLGGTGGFDSYFLPGEGDEAMPTEEFFFNSSSGYGGLISGKYSDTSSQESGIYFQNYTPSNDQYFQMFADDWSSNTTYSNANIYGYAGPDGVGLSLNASDSSSHNENNGIQIYATGIDLNAKNIQLNYFPNNSDSSLILTTDSLGNIVQRSISSFTQGDDIISGGDFFVGNGLMWNGSQIGLGGNDGFNATYLPTDGYGLNSAGQFWYTNSSNSWGIQASMNSDSRSEYSALYLDTDLGVDSTVNFQEAELQTSFSSSNSSSQYSGVYEYSGNGGPGISINVTDSLSNVNNGIQIYDNGMDLNTPNIQLNYFPNNSSNDLILSTDSLGDLVQKSFADMLVNLGGVPGNLVTAGNGLYFNGSELDMGGTNGVSAYYTPPVESGLSSYGQFAYDNYYDGWTIASRNETDSISSAAALLLNSSSSDNSQTFELYSEYYLPETSSSSYVDMYAFSGNTDPGLSLVVYDSLSAGENNGIQIYDRGIDLNTPVVQLNYFPNTPSMDSVLVTDSLGYLKQRAISSFTNGHWYLSGTTTYDTADNIGIGTTTPQSKLAVNGTVTALKVKVTQSGWPDYVFDSAYVLTPLHDLEKYLQKNRHLPEITSAGDIEKNGLDLGDSQSSLLKKVEELTLYIIKQDKEIDALKEQAKKVKLLEDKINALLAK